MMLLRRLPVIVLSLALGISAPSAQADVVPATVYRGKAGHLVLSPNGNRAAIIFDHRLMRPDVGGFAVVDGKDGHIVRVVDLPECSITFAAFSSDDRRILTWRGCTGSGAALVETDLTTGTETNLSARRSGADWIQPYSADEGQAPGAIRAAAYDGRDPDRIFLIAAPDRNEGDAHFSRRAITYPFSVLTLSRRTKVARLVRNISWPTPPNSLPQSTLVTPVLTTDGRLIALTRDIEKSPSATTISIYGLAAGQPRDVAIDLAPIAGRIITAVKAGKRLLIQESVERDKTPKDDSDRLARADLPTGVAPQIVPVAGLDGDIVAAAMSEDGQRVAFVNQPIEGEDQQPRLYFASVDNGMVIPTNALQQIGLGRIVARSPVDGEILLRRLKALSESGTIFDPASVGRTLGARIEPDVYGHAQISGDIVTSTDGSQYYRSKPPVPDTASLYLALHAGPCLTPEHIRAVFGSTSWNIPEMGVIPPR